MHASLESESPARFVVGIDLGTTNSALNFIDTEVIPWHVEIFRIPQRISPTEVESHETLPSFHYEPASGEMGATALSLPWQAEAKCVVGWMAREHGPASHGRVITSAKSWLCHGGVDRLAKILPWQAADESIQISPVEASARYLQHLRQAWDYAHPNHPLAQQDVVLTLPASFDEIARELTIQAASQAGLPKVILIEEPQAAFYAWVDEHRDTWHQRVTLGQNILVVDVGGGTTDLTLIRVRRREKGEGEEIQFHRVAVGDHLILGGDNLDLALAHHLEPSFGQTLDAKQWEQLLRQSRRAKEILLGENPPDTFTIHLAGSGSRLVGGGVQTHVTREVVQSLLVEGFFPSTNLTEDPQTAQSGFQEFSLPYAKDHAITRYLAKFLRDHATDELGCQVGPVRAVRPDIVLLNGGVFSSPAIRAQLMAVLSAWFSTSETQWHAELLPNARLDQAVAHGAAYYGMVRRGLGERIAAGIARSYYLGIDAGGRQAVCLVPGTAEPGDSIELAQTPFELLLSQPAEFPLYASSTRLADKPGQVVPIDAEHMKSLPPIRTALQATGRRKAERVQVILRADLTEIGTLELWCLASQDTRRWRLQFDVRSATATDIVSQLTHGEAQGVCEESDWTEFEQVLQQTFGPNPTRKPAELIKTLNSLRGLDRWHWPMPLLRRIWECLMKLSEGRRHGAAYEARWLNLLGFALRPGYGMAVDDWRVAETWRMIQGKLVHGTVECRNEVWVLWRRIAGGMSANQQQALADPYLASLRASRKRWLSGGTGGRADIGFQPQEAGELYRMLASLEWLNRAVKRELGELFLDLLTKRKWDAVQGPLMWAVGRLGSRVPLYGPLNTVIESAIAETWMKRIVELQLSDETLARLAMVQLARRTGDRQRDISPTARQTTLDWLALQPVPDAWHQMIATGGPMDRDTEENLWGDALPPGLRLLHSSNE